MKIVSDKLSARITGVCLLLAIVCYAVGNGLTESVLNGEDDLYAINKTQLTTGGLLMLCNSIVIIIIGSVMFPVLKRYNPQIASLYLITRIVESILLTIGIIFLMSHIMMQGDLLTLQSNELLSYTLLSKVLIALNYYSYQIAMLLLGIGSTLFCYVLYQNKLLPRFITLWGIIGYVLLSVGVVFELYGCKIGLLLSLPGGFFEIFTGIWLIVKGFNNKAKQGL